MLEAIAGIPAEQRDDVYVIHLMLESPDDDNRRVIATVAWNTNQHLRAKQARAAADRRMRFEWFSLSFAEPRARVIGETDEDVELLTQWLHEAGLWYEDEQADLAVTDQEPLIWDAFLSAIVEIVESLHADGTFERILGKDVPVLLDTDLDDEDGLRELNRRANPASFHPHLDRWSARGLADK